MLDENKDKRITVRFSESDYKYLALIAYMTGMTVSQYIRTICAGVINAAKLSEKEGKITDEDFKALFDDKL